MWWKDWTTRISYILSSCPINHTVEFEVFNWQQLHCFQELLVSILSKQCSLDNIILFLHSVLFPTSPRTYEQVQLHSKIIVNHRASWTSLRSHVVCRYKLKGRLQALEVLGHVYRHGSQIQASKRCHIMHNLTYETKISVCKCTHFLSVVCKLSNATWAWYYDTIDLEGGRQTLVILIVGSRVKRI